MKKAICFVVLLGMILTMSACSRTSQLGGRVNDETGGLEVTAVNARNSAITGGVTLWEGECLVISPVVDRGCFDVKVTEAATDREVLSLSLDGKALSSYDLAPGDYTLRISVGGRTDGTLSVTPYDAAELAAQDAALAEILGGLDPDAQGPDFAGAAIPPMPDIPELGNDDYYEVATSVGRQLVEITAYNVRQFCLDRDWESLSGMIRYPIEINGRTLGDAEEFLRYAADRDFTQEFMDSVTAESCRDMFANSYGISMADGYIWLGQVEEDGIKLIRIISFSGIGE